MEAPPQIIVEERPSCLPAFSAIPAQDLYGCLATPTAHSDVHLQTMTGDNRHTALYPGTFDPVTFGHLDVIMRGRRLFDRLVVGVGQNPDKQTLFSGDERLAMIQTLIEELADREPDLAPVEVIQYSGLTVDCARDAGATILLKGIRNLHDLQYEIQQAVTNREVAGLETAFVVAEQRYAFTSSTLIRQIASMGDDLNVLAPMCPPLVIERLREKKARDPEAFRNYAAAH